MEYILSTKLGLLTLKIEDEYIREISFLKDQDLAPSKKLSALAESFKLQLTEYLKGERREFDLPYRLEAGSDFQKKTWLAMKEIPYGEVVTYGKLATSIGHHGASRAIGSACNKNPLPLIIPCHRVVAANGLGGFAWGLETKRELLTLESLSI